MQEAGTALLNKVHSVGNTTEVIQSNDIAILKRQVKTYFGSDPRFDPPIGPLKERQWLGFEIGDPCNDKVRARRTSEKGGVGSE